MFCIFNRGMNIHIVARVLRCQRSTVMFCVFILRVWIFISAFEPCVSTEWTRRCLIRARLSRKHFPQSSHLYLLPWTLLCTTSARFFANRLSQTLHAYMKAAAAFRHKPLQLLLRRLQRHHSQPNRLDRIGIDSSSRFVKQEQWKCCRAEQKLVSGSKHRGRFCGVWGY